MKSRIAILLAFLIASSIAVLFHTHRHVQTLWLENASQTLASRGAPPADLIRTFRPGNWAGNGYILFSNGWAAFACHTFHDSEKIGDVALLRTPDGVLYVSHFHFCIGEMEFFQQAQPRDFQRFLQIYGTKQGWKRKPDAS
jgi:hypothetical protein